MVIIYKSNTGYTREYAKLLGKALDMPAYSIDEAPACHDGNEVIFLGWIMAGGITGYKAAAKRYKLRCVCGVGMGADNDTLVPGFRESLKIPESVAVFYLQGGFDMNRLSGPYKLIMKVVVKDIAKKLSEKESLTEGERALQKMTYEPGSCVCPENLQKVVDWYRRL